MRKLHPLILALGSGNFVPQLSSIANARDDYETGWDNVEGGDYETTGEDGEMMGAAAPLALRPMAARMPAARPAPRPVARPAATPYRAPVQSGPSVAQVQALVRSEIDRALAARVPYGDVPQRPRPDEAMFPMGLGFVTLTQAAPALTLEARPQRAFRGERLILQVYRGTGAEAATVLVDEFTVGDYKQTVGDGLVDAAVFAPDAFGVRLMLDGTVPGVIFRIPLIGVNIPPATSVVVTASVIGRAGEAAAR